MRKILSEDRIAYYVPQIFPTWFSGPPANRPNSQNLLSSHAEFWEVVYEVTISYGIKVMANRGGAFTLDTHNSTHQYFAYNPRGNRFDFHAHVRLRQAQLQIFNGLMLALHSSSVSKDGRAWGTFRASMHDLITLNEQWKASSHGGGGLRSTPLVNSSLGPYDDTEVLSLEVIKTAIDILDAIMSTEGNEGFKRLELAALTNEALYHFREFNYPFGLIAAWTACEVMLDKLWNNHTVNHGGKRRKKLEGRDYTSSVRIEILNEIGVVSGDLYQRLETARTARNRWVHDMKTPDRAVSAMAVETATQMLSSHIGQELNVSIHEGNGLV